MIYEPDVNASPILLHNVPIRDSRHCGSVHHLALASGTPGERERGTETGAGDQRRQGGIKKQKIAQCIIYPSIIALWLRRAHD